MLNFWLFWPKLSYKISKNTLRGCFEMQNTIKFHLNHYVIPQLSTCYLSSFSNRNHTASFLQNILLLLSTFPAKLRNKSTAFTKTCLEPAMIEFQNCFPLPVFRAFFWGTKVFLTSTGSEMADLQILNSKKRHIFFT